MRPLIAAALIISVAVSCFAQQTVSQENWDKIKPIKNSFSGKISLSLQDQDILKITSDFKVDFATNRAKLENGSFQFWGQELSKAEALFDFNTKTFDLYIGLTHTCCLYKYCDIVDIPQFIHDFYTPYQYVAGQNASNPWTVSEGEYTVNGIKSWQMRSEYTNIWNFTNIIHHLYKQPEGNLVRLMFSDKNFPEKIKDTSVKVLRITPLPEGQGFTEDDMTLTNKPKGKCDCNLAHFINQDPGFVDPNCPKEPTTPKAFLQHSSSSSTVNEKFNSIGEMMATLASVIQDEAFLQDLYLKQSIIMNE